MSTKHATNPTGAARPSNSQLLAEQVVAGQGTHDLSHYVRTLTDPRSSVANQAARVVEEVVRRDPQRGVALIQELTPQVASEHKRVAQTVARTLPAIARLAPARVAKQLPQLIEAFDTASPEGRDGVVRTFAALCAASIAYQKRLEEVLCRALRTAPPRQFVQWSMLILPILKGEPHAHARAIVWTRLEELPRPEAQKLADLLGTRLRPTRPLAEPT